MKVNFLVLESDLDDLSSLKELSLLVNDYLSFATENSALELNFWTSFKSLQLKQAA